MKREDIKIIIINLAKLLRSFLDRTILIFLTIILISIGFGTVIGYRYIAYPIRGDFSHENELVVIDAKSYHFVRKIWIEKEERLKVMEEKVFSDPFSPVAVDLIEPINEDITPEELEDILARTLFEFYQTRGEEMPPISERALIWEELKLGSAQEYQGTHSQNILFLKTLMEIMNNQPAQDEIHR